ncbi:RNA-binding cell elongation regulator Jag/EloR [Alkalihalophilus marmarensis]|uniref:RNA-binding cell elongation regulator Jag/EloR n=1 Tax=Alkalihalophilus marmarensis TaxID=521377 RepID=UPI002DBA17F7|nr:RNA-binding cell elongation regulator Jag/EloR [Alkalihalophilus marmarensis]MEC2071443.1 RNA-binding cell elongation regulator Jag/EloR [Alkalihalophilus marmarensis]
MTHVTVSGNTIEEAVQKALLELETTEARLSYQVVSEPKKGFLGFGSRPATIEAHIKPDPIMEAYSFLESTVTLMGVPATIVQEDIDQGDKQVRFDIKSSNEAGRLIGKRGQTLEALDYLTNLVANRHKDAGFVAVEVDAENYRERRKEALMQLAHRVAEKAKAINKPVSLEPMSAKERKIIHSTLQSVSGVETYSKGQGRDRHIVVRAK